MLGQKLFLEAPFLAGLVCDVPNGIAVPTCNKEGPIYWLICSPSWDSQSSGNFVWGPCTANAPTLCDRQQGPIGRLISVVVDPPTPNTGPGIWGFVMSDLLVFNSAAQGAVISCHCRQMSRWTCGGNEGSRKSWARWGRLNVMFSDILRCWDIFLINISMKIRSPSWLEEQ